MKPSIQKFSLMNLDCANCAAQIEAEVKELPGVRFASLNFATSTLHLEVDNIEEVRAVINRIEPGAILKAAIEHKEDQSKTNVLGLLAISFSVALLVGGMFVRSRLNLAGFRYSILFFVGAYLLSGGDVLARAARTLWRRKWFDETFLMSIATIGAFAIGEYPEAVGVMLFYKIGEYLQKRSVARSRRSIQDLLEVRTYSANLKMNGNIESTAPEEVKVGAVVVIRPGERVPLDGVVIDGTSNLDTSAITGESMPRYVERGDQVLAGMINQSGLLEVEVTKEFSDSSISRMMALVEEAASRKSTTENFITRFAKYYTPIVVGLAAIIAFLPPLLFRGESFHEWVYRALILLVISCPCALMISIPLGYFGGVGGASRRGILVKGANFLDALAKARTVVFDKTGTLTRGQFEVVDISPQNGFSSEELLRIAASAESNSSHPIAQSITKAYGRNDWNGIESLEELAGFGILAKLEGKEVLIGSDAILHKYNVEHSKEVCKVFGTQVHIAVNREYAGYLVVMDSVKPDARQAIQLLREEGVERIIMLTGDRAETASGFSEKLDLDGYLADLLPEEKVSAVDELMRKHQTGTLVFVGDGINDAPVIARADVGIAMGALGSDAAIESADVVLMTDAPKKVVEAIKIAKNTRRIVWQNIILALSIKAVFILLGALGVASMWEAVFADVGVTIIAVFNALRVLRM